jgi:glycosyltransferase involved in cell wall biosynthesis
MVTEFKPLVSIGMPTYNRADDYLPLALDSALAAGLSQSRDRRIGQCID